MQNYITCPAMRHLWILLKENSELKQLYNTSSVFQQAFNQNVSIERLILLYENTRNMLMEENIKLHLMRPHVIHAQGADPVVAVKLEQLATTVLAYYGLESEEGVDAADTALEYLKKCKAIREWQD
jgi:hypothetical protein